MFKTLLTLILTIYEATAGSKKLRKCNSPRAYFIRTKKHFCLLQPSPVWRFLPHWSRETNPRFSWHTEHFPKSYQREVIKNIAYKAPKPQSVLLAALHLKRFSSLTNVQASQARQSTLKSKDRLPNHDVVQIAARIERWQTVDFQLSVPDTKTRTVYNNEYRKNVATNTPVLRFLAIAAFDRAHQWPHWFTQNALAEGKEYSYILYRRVRRHC